MGEALAVLYYQYCSDVLVLPGFFRLCKFQMIPEFF